MTTLLDIKGEAVIMMLLAGVMVFCLSVLYSMQKNKEWSVKFTNIAVIISMSLIAILYRYFYITQKEELLNQFDAGYEVICRSNKEKILISKDRGYKLKGKYFIKDDRLIEYEECTTIK